MPQVVGIHVRLHHGSIAIMVRYSVMSSPIRGRVGMTKGTAVAVLGVSLIPNGGVVVVCQARVAVVVHDTRVSSGADIVVPVGLSGVLIATKNAVTTSGVGVYIVVAMSVALIVARKTWPSVVDGIMVVATVIASVVILIAVDKTLVLVVVVVAIVPGAGEETHDSTSGCQLREAGEGAGVRIAVVPVRAATVEINSSSSIQDWLNIEVEAGGGEGQKRKQ